MDIFGKSCEFERESSESNAKNSPSLASCESKDSLSFAKNTPPQPLPQGEGLIFNSPSIVSYESKDSPSLACGESANSPSLAEGVRGWVKSNPTLDSRKSNNESNANSSESNLDSHKPTHDSPFPRLDSLPKSLLALKKPPKALFYKGDLSLLDSFKVAIVGTRAPNPYTKSLTAELSNAITKCAVVVSGGALGVDIIAHKHAFPRTIMIAPSSLDIIYPRENAQIIQKIYDSALVLSEYERDYIPQKYSFLQRNRLVIAISDIVILPQGDLKSGTSSSAKYALTLGKPIFTLPHRYNESTLTNALLARGEARAIYNISDFINEHILPNISESMRESTQNLAESNLESDEILSFCAKNPTFEEAFAKFGSKVLEYEFSGLLVRENNTIRVKAP